MTTLQRSNHDKILWSEVEQDVIEIYKKFNLQLPSGIAFPHHKRLLSVVGYPKLFINDVVGQ